MVKVTRQGSRPLLNTKKMSRVPLAVSGSQLKPLDTHHLSKNYSRTRKRVPSRSPPPLGTLTAILDAAYGVYLVLCVVQSRSISVTWRKPSVRQRTLLIQPIAPILHTKIRRLRLFYL